MNRDPIFKHVALAFLGALILYVCGFKAIEHFRNVKGPWKVTFRTGTNGHPSITVNHETLSLTNVTLALQGEQISLTNSTTTIVFDSPKTNVPFGKIIFLDTTVLPGTVTFDLFGHEIEFLPRVMVVNRKEVPWKSESVLNLTPSEKLHPASESNSR